MQPTPDPTTDLEALAMQGAESNETLKSIEVNTEAAVLNSNKAQETLEDISASNEAQIIQAEQHINRVAPSLESLGRAMQTVDTILNTMRGPKGEKGDKGDQGERGPQGAPLTWSTLTAAQRKSLVGPKGEKGEQGPPGRDGRDGRDGVDGQDGRDGVDGKDGRPGEPGKDAPVAEIVKKVTERVTKDATELVNQYTERVSRHVAAKTYSVSELEGMGTATAGQVPVKQADGSWAPGDAGGLPDQTGNSGKFLTTDGSDASWATLAGGGDMAAATYDPANKAEQVLTVSDLSDTAYDATTWNGVTNKAPSKNAVRDKIEALDAAKANASHTHTASEITDLGSATVTFTNKTFDANGTGNSISNIEVADFASGVVDTDLSSVSGTDNTIPSAKATKTALDGKVGTGAVTSSGLTMATSRVLGRTTASTGAIEELTSVDSFISAASDTTAGKIEIATTSETNTGTDTGRAVSPDGLAGSYAGTKSVVLDVIAAGTDLTTGDNKYSVVMPSSVNGMDLVAAHARVFTAGTTGTTDIQLHNVTDAVDILTTKITIDSTETTSYTAATPPSINTSNDSIATGDIIRVDIDAISTTAPKGLQVILEFRLP